MRLKVVIGGLNENKRVEGECVVPLVEGMKKDHKIELFQLGVTSLIAFFTSIPLADADREFLLSYAILKRTTSKNNFLVDQRRRPDPFHQSFLLFFNVIKRSMSSSILLILLHLYRSSSSKVILQISPPWAFQLTFFLCF